VARDRIDSGFPTSPVAEFVFSSKNALISVFFNRLASRFSGSVHRMPMPSHETEELIQRVAAGDERAASQLLALHRQRLRRMVAIRLDEQILARLDPSDVVQETMIQAVRRLPEYSRTRPIPFYPWLRQLAWDQIVHAHRHHFRQQKRSIHREQPRAEYLSGASQDLLVNHLIASQTSPSKATMREELKSQVRSALGQLTPSHREILVLLFLERLSMNEAAAVLGVTQEAARSRQRRALEQFSRLVRPLLRGQEP
jgi:RNA polymerase sigma-70 factor (ECF subfamily)